MCNKCKFVTKKMTKESKQDIVRALEKVRTSYSKKFKKGMNFGLVGSARRNLVYQRGNSDWDMDWQIFIDGDKLEKDLGGTKEIKEWFASEIKKYLPNTYKYHNSTSVITFNKTPKDENCFKSYDIAILSINSSTGLINFIKFDKGNQQFIWNELKNSDDRNEKIKKIKGSDMWKTLRSFYKEKKCENFNKSKDDETKKTSSEIYIESVNHTLQVHK